MMKSIMSKSIFLAIPAYGAQVCSDFMLSVIKLERECRSRGIDIEYQICANESLISRARNDLCASFLASSASHLLFIDADIAFDPVVILDMVELDLDVVCGIYPKKTINWKRVYDNRLTLTAEEMKNISRDFVLVKDEGSVKLLTPFEIRYGGTGLMCVRRNVLDAMISHYPHDFFTTSEGRQFMFFNTGIVDGYYLSEDYWFCDRWNKLGGKVFGYARTINSVIHWGMYGY